uniref:Brl1/Brr6 domain-containing protein n=1 Tax=Chromera velia CCMP2878 TaxID=1169474 RepID=A0A0G4HZA9_9ALVE|eukprot:Cvel_9666.t1-p1 / transcript=Cvel_9666.t1 / gene=Cvel_9666 / organism=Chromera_velia_CCMP2878 / gene_product=Nucleus export protein BRR6, putative / transcript_product=Nucleus export protein BRR6, putative / location=Cvel_scaffold563:13007-24851(+) / protein_length=748 / sequence_SO=supercontig / SO=protein_coding / is_pseudo=false
MERHLWGRSVSYGNLECASVPSENEETEGQKQNQPSKMWKVGRQRQEVSSKPLRESRLEVRGQLRQEQRGVQQVPLQLCVCVNGWIQVGFNLGVAALGLYVMWGFVWFVREDIQAKVELQLHETRNQINECANQYRLNGCATVPRVPILEEPCSAWERCMGQNPSMVSRRAAMTAQTIGEALNAAVVPIEGRTVAILSLLFLGLVVMSNLAFSIALLPLRPFPSRSSSSALESAPQSLNQTAEKGRGREGKKTEDTNRAELQTDVSRDLKLLSGLSRRHTTSELPFESHLESSAESPSMNPSLRTLPDRRHLSAPLLKRRRVSACMALPSFSFPSTREGAPVSAGISRRCEGSVHPESSGQKSLRQAEGRNVTPSSLVRKESRLCNERRGASLASDMETGQNRQSTRSHSCTPVPLHRGWRVVGDERKDQTLQSQPGSEFRRSFDDSVAGPERVQGSTGRLQMRSTSAPCFLFPSPHATASRGLPEVAHSRLDVYVFSPPAPAPWKVWVDALREYKPSFLTEERAQHERLIDAYRLRIEDDADHDLPRGIAARLLHLQQDGEIPNVSASVLDFLVFCRLAQKKHMIPEGWNWGEFLKTAEDLVIYSFDKGDAKEKWGSESFFAMGSLRSMATEVYGRAFGDNSKAEEGDMLGEEWEWQSALFSEGVRWDQIENLGDPPRTCARLDSESENDAADDEEEVKMIELDEDLFENVGGYDAWNRLARRVMENDESVLENNRDFVGLHEEFVF